MRWMLLLLLMGSMLAAEPDCLCYGVKFPTTCSIAGQNLSLRGSGQQTYLVFTVATIALYTPDKLPVDQVLLATQPRRIELNYHHAIRAEQFRDLTEKSFNASNDAEVAKALAGSLAALNALYVDMAVDDRYAVVCAPGAGVTLYKNAERLGQVNDDAFATAFCSIWLGDKGISAGLRAKLLGIEVVTKKDGKLGR